MRFRKKQTVWQFTPQNVILLPPDRAADKTTDPLIKHYYTPVMPASDECALFPHRQERGHGDPQQASMDNERYVSIGDGNVYLAKVDPLDIDRVWSI